MGKLCLRNPERREGETQPSELHRGARLLMPGTNLFTRQGGKLRGENLDLSFRASSLMQVRIYWYRAKFLARVTFPRFVNLLWFIFFFFLSFKRRITNGDTRAEIRLKMQEQRSWKHFYADSSLSRNTENRALGEENGRDGDADVCMCLPQVYLWGV